MRELEATLTEIVERSAFLHERMGEEYCPKQPSAVDIEAAQKRMAYWRQQVDRGEEVDFERRLAGDGLDRRKAEELAAGVRLRAPPQPPDWVQYLEHVIANSSNSNNDKNFIANLENAPFLSLRNPVPFEHLFVSGVEYATEKLKAAAGDSWGLLSPAAKLDIQRTLLKTLSWAAGKTLDFEFSVWRTLPETQFISPGNPGRQLYMGFVRSMLQGGMLTLFTEYPVLARWLARI